MAGHIQNISDSPSSHLDEEKTHDSSVSKRQGIGNKISSSIKNIFGNLKSEQTQWVAILGAAKDLYTFKKNPQKYFLHLQNDYENTLNLAKEMVSQLEHEDAFAEAIVGIDDVSKNELITQRKKNLGRISNQLPRVEKAFEEYQDDINSVEKRDMYLKKFLNLQKHIMNHMLFLRTHKNDLISF